MSPVPHSAPGTENIPESKTLAWTRMTSARSAQARWIRLPLRQRLGCVRRLRSLIARNATALGAASAMSRSRPTAEAMSAEVMPLAEACRFLEREASKILKPRRLGRRGLPLWLSQTRSEIHREPFGVVLIVGPGNYPLFLPGVQMIQALVAGNAVILKPGVAGSAAARALIDLMVQAGFDENLIALLPESVGAVQDAINARPDKVVFTGSSQVGEEILKQLAPGLIPATMELSGSDPVIVREDADLELTIKALVFGLTLNNGATCMAPKRVFVARSIASEFEGRLAEALRRNHPTNLLAESNRAQHYEHSSLCRALVADALTREAHLIAGEIRADGSLAGPVVLGGVSPKAALLQADLFEPVLAVITTRHDGEALFWANDSQMALGASIFSRDKIAASILAAELNSGVVSINDLIVPTADPRLPFGGTRRSGFGVTRGAEGLLNLTRPKVITFTRGRFRPAFEPLHPANEILFTSYLNLMHSTGWRSRFRAFSTVLRTVVRHMRSPGNYE